MKPIRTVAVFPTLFTLGNLVCGFFAIVAASRIDVPTSREVQRSERYVTRQFDRGDENHNLVLAGCLIFAAMIFDALDGHVARLAKSTTEFGAQLDSLADAVTFGVAPAILLVKMCHSVTFLQRNFAVQPVWLIAAAFAVCAALRLARFNVESDEEDDHLHFNGLPSPAAGGTIASFAILFYRLRLEDTRFAYAEQIDQGVQMVLPIFALLLAVLMVSRVPYPHFVNQLLRGHRSFGHVVALVLSLLVLMIVPEIAIPALLAGFVLAPPAWYFYQRFVQRRSDQEPLF